MQLKRKPEPAPIIVRDKSGGLIALDSMKQFNPAFHEKYVPDIEAAARQQEQEAADELDLVPPCVNCGRSPFVKEQALEKPKKAKPVKEEVQEEVEADVETEEGEENSEEEKKPEPTKKDGKARFMELKASKAWTKDNLKEEYYALKKIHG